MTPNIKHLIKLWRKHCRMCFCVSSCN